MEFAEFLEEMGLGERSELEKILLDTGLRQRGIGELVRGPTTWTIFQHGGPSHLGLW